MDAFFNTTLLAALAEMGDKTQIMAILLVARYRKPWPIATALLFATMLSTAITTGMGAFIADVFPIAMLRWIVVALFFAVAVWILMPEQKNEEDEFAFKSFASVGLTAFTAFLLNEIGDKSQATTLIMAAKNQQFWLVMAGATCGAMVAILPAIWLGKTTAQWLPVKSVRIVSAGLFAAFGCWVLAYGLS